MWLFEKPCGHPAFFKGHVAIQVFGKDIWPSGPSGDFGGPCSHLVSQGSCAHLALRKDMWLPGLLKGHVSIWPFEGPCGHLMPFGPLKGFVAL
jgi:hypothetical protein